jgi:hypothetical protein
MAVAFVLCSSCQWALEDDQMLRWLHERQVVEAHMLEVAVVGRPDAGQGAQRRRQEQEYSTSQHLTWGRTRARK